MPRRKVSREPMICPVCFVIFPTDSVDLRYLSCPHCESEAIGVDREPLSRFLDRVPLRELERIALEWDHQEGFLATYKAEKASRLKALIRMQKARVS